MPSSSPSPPTSLCARGEDAGRREQMELPPVETLRGFLGEFEVEAERFDPLRESPQLDGWIVTAHGVAAPGSSYRAPVVGRCQTVSSEGTAALFAPRRRAMRAYWAE